VDGDADSICRSAKERRSGLRRAERLVEKRRKGRPLARGTGSAEKQNRESGCRDGGGEGLAKRYSGLERGDVPALPQFPKSCHRPFLAPLGGRN
jgi:hypothetical protein